jgi:hypothetical protein
MMVAKGQVATAEEVKARWAYCEMDPRSRFYPCYANQGPSPLLDWAKEGKPFSEIPTSDWPELLRRLAGARPDFHANADGAAIYVCEGWTKDKLRSVFTIPFYESVPYPAFMDGKPKDDPGDPRRIIEEIEIPQEYRQDEPVIIVMHPNGWPILLEGYLRSLMFMRSPDPAAELLAWVPK